jgi:hypothetical protein
MPLFYFDIEDGVSRGDDTGTELPDLEAVKREAIRTAAGLLNETKVDFWNGDRWTMRVRDEAGNNVLSLQILAVPPKPSLTVVDPVPAAPSNS